MDEIREALDKIGIPGRDLYDLPSSTKRFPDGCHWRVEISGVERPSTLQALIEESKKRDVPVHRLISTVMGSTLLPRDELTEFAELAAEAEMEVIITPGPRAPWDVGRQVATPEGALSGIRYRGSDQLSYVIADIMRSIELGFRGFLVIDEGLLWLLNELRAKGDIPDDVIFKVSIYAGHGSAAGAKLVESLGAATFNPLCDLSLPQFASIRRASGIPLDIHILIAESFGGNTRFYDAPEMARVLSPCYFKLEPGPACAATGAAIYKPWVDAGMLADWAREKVKYAQIIRELIQENNPSLKMSAKGPADLAIPKP